MAEIKTNINHVKTYLNDLERECDNLIDNRVKSSAPKARAIAQKIKLIMIDLRKDIQKNAAESAQLQSYIEGILKPANEDIDLAIQLVCSAPDRHKLNGFKSIKSQNIG